MGIYFSDLNKEFVFYYFNLFRFIFSGLQGLTGSPGQKGQRGQDGSLGMPGPVGHTPDFCEPGEPGSQGMFGPRGPIGPPGNDLAEVSLLCFRNACDVLSLLLFRFYRRKG